jgi:hypothetical protein
MPAMIPRTQKAALLAFLTALTIICSAQEMPGNQPPLWSTKPDITAFEKIQNDRLAVAQRAIDSSTPGAAQTTTSKTV